MSDTAWLWNYPNTELVKSYAVEAAYPDYYDARTFIELEIKKESGKATQDDEKEYYDLVNQSVALNKKLWRCENIEDKHMPNKAYIKPNCNTPTSENIAFQFPNGLLLVNQTLYDILSKHNLGKTHFSEVFIYDFQSDKKVIEEPYYFLNLAEKREFLDIEKSKGIRASSYEPESPERYLNFPKDNDIILDSLMAKANIAMWHDTVLDSSIFLSDDLVQDIFSTGIKQESIGLIRCLISP